MDHSRILRAFKYAKRLLPRIEYVRCVPEPSIFALKTGLGAFKSAAMIFRAVSKCLTPRSLFLTINQSV